MGIRDARVDLFDTLNGKRVAGRRLGEFIRAVAGANGNRQRVDLSRLYKRSGFFGVGQQLFHIQLAFGTNAVLFTSHAGFQATQAAQLAFYRDATGVGHFYCATSNVNVVVVIHWRLAIFTQRAVHHDGGETELDRALAYRRAGAVILVHHYRNMRELFHRCQNQVAQEGGARVFTRASGGLHDHRRVGSIGGFHDSPHLFKVVDVERGDTVAIFGGVVEHLAHAN